MTKTVDGIVIRREEKKHGIGWIVIALGASAAIAVILVALIALSGVFTGTGLADSPGGALPVGMATVIPSDEDGGIVHGDGFTVTTIGKGKNSKAGKDFYLGDEPARIEDVKFIGVKSKTDERITIRLDYKMVPEKDISGRRAINRVYISQTKLEDLTRGTCKSGYIFCLFSESQRNEKGYYQYQTTRYFQIRSYSSREDYIAYTPVYKVSHI